MLNILNTNKYKIKGKVFYGQKPPVENLLSLFVGSITTYSS